ncbi:bacteriohemerythrin [uncultured Pseudodesulfovibrio sp.]|uniref:bacteriohemerythrin n=1 Tax=uncultured Pseudodesulfovibrio sp. TaxID=2035858 RepID=UPI0029C8833B|nr:bacteriohemerythrin [uncultured Pseudodesulfovibrio sp.]
MGRLEWSPELSLGQPELDDQHKELIRIANGLINAVSIGRRKRTVENVIRKLREYTVFHFVREESLMEQIRFPGRADHMAEHVRLKLSVKNYQRKLYEHEHVRANDVLDFMTEWLLGHILTFDRDFAVYMTALDETAKAERSESSEVVEAGNEGVPTTSDNE